MTTEKVNAFKQVVQKVFPEAKLVDVRKLEGGVSAQITLLEVEQSDGGRQKLIVREYGRANLEHDPHSALHEDSLLKTLRTNGLPVPVPLHVDESCLILPTPYIIISFIEAETVGEPLDVTDFVRQMARILAKIHTVTLSSDIDFLQDQTVAFTSKLREVPATLDESLSEALIRDALTKVWPPTQTNRSILLHGDFWPGNTMWKDDQLVGVIDWEDAAVGDPLADLGNGRLEILMFFGIEAAEAFTAEYQLLAPNLDYSNLPYWDLCAALRPAGKMASWGLDEITLHKLQMGHRRFVDTAIQKISRQAIHGFSE
jgi:aminoglycoside phosphotransferase (APT) family kinase protein